MKAKVSMQVSAAIEAALLAVVPNGVSLERVIQAVESWAENSAVGCSNTGSEGTKSARGASTVKFIGDLSPMSRLWSVNAKTLELEGKYHCGVAVTLPPLVVNWIQGFKPDTQ